MIDDFVAHVRLYMWQLLRAIAQIDEKGDLSIQIDYSASAAIAVEKETAKAALTCVGFFAVFVIEAEDKPAEMQSVQKDHKVKT